MTFRAEPYGVFVDDLVSNLTGGVTREQFRFDPEEEPFQLGARDDVVAGTVRVHGIVGEDYHRFLDGIDFDVDDTGTVVFRATAEDLPVDGSRWPDPGSTFWASYERTPDPQAPPTLTDRNPGSVTRTLAESFAREYAVLSRQLEAVYDAAFVDSAEGRDLDHVASLVGVVRRTQRFARGEIVLTRSNPAPGDIHVPAGTRVSSADVPVVEVETTVAATLRRGTLSVAVPVQALVAGAPGIAPAHAITVIHRPIHGVDAATNPQPMAFGPSAETDDALRRRVRRSLDGSGRSTVGAVIGALTTVDGIREQDVLVVEDHVAHPGIVKVTVAAELSDVAAHRAALVLEDARPAGVRIVHNLPVAPPPADIIGPGGGATPGTPPPPGTTDPLWFPVAVTAVATPADADLNPTQKATLRQDVQAAIEAAIGALGAGQVVVYNQLVASIMDVDGVDDVVVDLAPATAATRDGRTNLFPVPANTRPRIDHLDVTLRGALVALDVTVIVERKGLSAANPDAASALDPIRSDIATRLGEVLPAMTEITAGGLAALLPETDDYRIDEIHYTAEFVDEGLRIVAPDKTLHPTPEEQPWLRGVRVTEETQGS